MKTFSSFLKEAKKCKACGKSPCDCKACKECGKMPCHCMQEDAKKMKGKDPCWKGYEMIGTKKKEGKTVPNCVPKESVGFTDPTGASHEPTATGAMELDNPVIPTYQNVPQKKTKKIKEEVLYERGADSKGYRRPTEKGAGLTKKGVMAYRRQNPGSKLQTAVTGKVKPGSRAAKRRKSFCARMSGVKGPMKDEKGRPTRKAMSLRRWRCRT